jgi:FkbM family methyltransferase
MTEQQKIEFKPEIDYYNNYIKSNLTSNVIFDIGTNKESIFSEEEGIEVHYFEPLKEELDVLKNQKCLNKKSFFNEFGLSDEDKKIPYYDCGSVFSRDKIGAKLIREVDVKRVDKYIEDNNIDIIDFIKIDVEGYEPNVLKGFGDKLNNVRFIQFEYGDGLMDCGYKMTDIIFYLKEYGFDDFYYLNTNGVKNVTGYHNTTDLIPLTNYNDHWVWCNIVCKNTKL